MTVHANENDFWLRRCPEVMAPRPPRANRARRAYALAKAEGVTRHGRSCGFGLFQNSAFYLFATVKFKFSAFLRPLISRVCL